MNRIELPESVTMSNVEALHGQLVAAARQPLLELDASAVTHIDTAGLQLLCALSRERRQASLPLQWVGRQTLEPMLAAAGLQDEL